MSVTLNNVRPPRRPAQSRRRSRPDSDTAFVEHLLITAAYLRRLRDRGGEMSPSDLRRLCTGLRGEISHLIKHLPRLLLTVG